MAKSFKYENDMYLDSTGIVHDRSNLYTILEELKKFKITKLWENSSPNSNFNAQTITLSSNKYTFLLIYYKEVATAASYIYSRCIPKGYGTRLSFSSTASDVKQITYSREMSRTSDTKFSIGAGTYYYGQGNSYGGNSNNLIIPVAIYGIEF